MSVIIDVAEAVVARLNDGAFSAEFTATRGYRPTYTLEDLATLRVACVPKSNTITAADRTKDFFDVAVDVAVQKKLTDNTDEDEATIDALVAVVERIVDHLRHHSFESLGDFIARWASITNDPIYSPGELSEKRLFASVLTVTYRLYR